MKGIFYVLSFFLPLLVADPVKDEDVCLNKLYLDKDVMKPLLEQVIHPVEESVDYNAFLECFWKRIGYMDERGDLYWDDIRVDYEAKFGKSDQLMRVVVHCKKQHLQGNNHGETAVKNQNCLMQGAVDYHLVG